jgi:DNA-binding beta-propeller fold protein YncE
VLGLLAAVLVLGFAFVTLTRSELPLLLPFRWGLLAAAFVAGLGATALSLGTLQGLRNPRDVLVGRDGLVYVSDFNGNAVRVFESTGPLVRTVGRPGSGNGELNGPLGLAHSDDGRLYVADSRNHRIQVFAADGTFLTSIGRQGTRPGELNSPHGLAIGSDGLVYVAERGNRRIQILTREGAFVGQIRGDGADGGETFTPAGICLTPEADVWVADIDGHRLLRARQGAVSVQLSR